MLLQVPGWRGQPQAPSISGRVVRSIAVQWEEEASLLHRYYDTGDKMQQVLLCIRSLGPMFLPDQDPEALPGPPVVITLTCADGSQKIYQQKGTCYFRTGTSPWQQLQPGKGDHLLNLLQQIPSDPAPEALDK